jgi:hypothetical protein
MVGSELDAKGNKGEQFEIHYVVKFEICATILGIQLNTIEAIRCFIWMQYKCQRWLMCSLPF